MTIGPAISTDAVLVFHEQLQGGGEAPPGHPFFGALFVFVGALLIVELLAGPVWRRHRGLTLFWPLALAASGAGMLVVTAVQPTEKSLHLTLAVLLLIGSYLELQYRHGYISRQGADMFAVPALIVGGFVIGPMHANGPILQSTTAQMHMLVGIVCWVLATIKLGEARLLITPSVSLSLRAGLDYSFGIGVMALGFSLLLVQQFHGAH